MSTVTERVTNFSAKNEGGKKLIDYYYLRNSKQSKYAREMTMFTHETVC